tara:strand:- start:42 stop:380 length:339 start_codon:yes stop_codon:yes gene_type:complete
MCAPAIIPIISAVGGIATAAQQLGILGGNRSRQAAQPQRTQTPPPQVQQAQQAASAAGDDEQIKPESIEVQQNAKQKRDKQTTKKGTGMLGALPGINTGTDTTTPSGTPNIG